jgi:hypothetical protein
MIGLKRFQEYFSDYKEQYVLIGGAACDLIFENEGVEFRPTKDLDVVLIIEAKTKEFGVQLWKFIRDGAYSTRIKGNGSQELFRFSKPGNEDFPYMIELFCRGPIDWPESYRSLPVRFDDELSSLSAILLDNDYYKLIVEGRFSLENISLLRPEYILLLKAKAYLDYYNRYRKGEYQHEKDIQREIRKHREDVFRLTTILDPRSRYDLPETIKTDIQLFIEFVYSDQNDPSGFLQRSGLSMDQITQTLRQIYKLP